MGKPLNLGDQSTILPQEVNQQRPGGQRNLSQRRWVFSLFLTLRAGERFRSRRIRYVLSAESKEECRWMEKEKN